MTNIRYAFPLPQPPIQSLPPTPPGVVIPQPTTMKIRSMLSSHLELVGSHFSPSSHRRWKFHPTMFPVHLSVQPVEVVVIGSFQELTPSVRGTISMFATVVVDIPSLSHHLPQFEVSVHVDWFWGLWYFQCGYCKSLLFMENQIWLLKRINIDWLIDWDMTLGRLILLCLTNSKIQPK